jgi:hypothetical protein
MEGKKNDQSKPQYGLLPPQALLQTVNVLTFGAAKYAPDNWRKVDNASERYFNAAQRHLWAHKSGFMVDEESGYSHLAHALCCIMFMLELELETYPELYTTPPDMQLPNDIYQ